MINVNICNGDALDLTLINNNAGETCEKLVKRSTSINFPFARFPFVRTIDLILERKFPSHRYSSLVPLPTTLRGLQQTQDTAANGKKLPYF